MSSQTYTLRAGITEPIEMQLLEVDPDTNVESAVSLSGVTLVRVAVREKCGGPAQSWDSDGSRVAVSDSANGKIIWSPPADAFNPGAYVGWVRVTDAQGSLVSFPSDGEFSLTVIGTY